MSNDVLGEIKLADNTRVLLKSDRQWYCNDKVIQNYLNSVFSLDSWYSSPSAGKIGWQALKDAAEELDGKFTYLAKWDKAKRNTVY